MEINKQINESTATVELMLSKAEAYYRYLEVDLVNQQRVNARNCMWLAVSILGAGAALTPIDKINAWHAIDPTIGTALVLAYFCAISTVILGIKTLDTGITRDPLSDHLSCTIWMIKDQEKLYDRKQDMLMHILKAHDRATERSIKHITTRGNLLMVMRHLLNVSIISLTYSAIRLFYIGGLYI